MYIKVVQEIHRGIIKDENDLVNSRTSIFDYPTLTLNIITQPLPQTDCYGNKVEFSVTVSGSVGTTTYQWQQKPPNGLFTDITGARSSTLNIDKIGVNGINVDGTEYRVIVSDNNSKLTSNSAVLHINSISPLLPKVVNSTICLGGNYSYSAPVTGAVVSYQWAINKGLGWTNISDNSNYSGVDKSKLSILNATTAQSGSYRISVTFQTLNQSDGYPTCIVTSNESRNLIVREELVAPVISKNQKICNNEIPEALTSKTPTGGSGPYLYQWQLSSDGITWTDITGAESLSYSPAKLSSSTYYRLVIKDNGNPSCGSVISDIILISVYQTPEANPILPN